MTTYQIEGLTRTVVVDAKDAGQAIQMAIDMGLEFVARIRKVGA